MEASNFVQRFDRVLVPETIHGLSEYEALEGVAAEVRKHFFNEVASSMMSHLAIQACFGERVTELRPTHAPKYVHELWIKNEQPVAFAYNQPERESGDDEFTNAPRLRSVSFGKYPLMNATKRTLAEIENLEDIIWRR